MRVSFDLSVGLGEKRLGGILDEAAALDGFLEPELKRRFIGDSNETATATMPMVGLPIRYESADAEDPEDFEGIFEAAASAPSKKRERATEWVHENDYEDLESEHLAADANGTEADEPVSAKSTDTDYSKINMLESHRTLSKVIYPNLYRRPVAPPVDPIVEDLVFQHVETTYDMDMRQQVPVVRIWGVTAQGNSVLVEDRTFLPYFFVAIPTQAEQDSIHERLEAFLLERFHTSRVAKLKGEAAKSPPRPFERYVESMQVEPEARPLQGPDVADVRMVRVTMRSPSHVSAARNALEQANRAVVPNASRYITYEANVPFELRYMIDHGIYGCQWLRLLAGTCDLPKDGETPQSRAQYEWRITKKPSGGRKKWDPIDTAKRGDIGPKRILSYDIEVLRKEAGFPTADKNPIIMIACALRVAGQKAPVQHKVCFVLRCKQTRKHVGQSNGSYFPLESAKENADEGAKDGQDAPTTVYVFDDERDLLMAWRQYVIESDPDAFSGWNIDNFDMPYMAGRASALGIYDQFMCFTRTIKKRCWIRESRFESKAYGVRINKELLCEGRFSFDGLLFMHRGQTNKYPSYKLNYFSKLFLKDEKLDVDYSQIPILFEGTDEDRTRLLWYCMKDTLLALRILDKLMAIVNGVEQCRVTGVPLKWLLIRGQGVKTFSALLRKKQPKEHPASRSPPARPTAGGHVEEPRRGFYTTPIVTVDFASLYPSIMRAYNICYTTKVSRAWAEANLSPDDYHSPWPSVDAIPPEGSEPETKKRKKKLSKKERDRVAAEAERAGKQTDFVFVKEHIRKGILPDMLEEFMKARSNVKNMMKKMSESDDLYCVFDGRQLALKIVCNSAYGFTKGFTVRDEDLMEAVTSWGRHLWEQVATKVLAHFRGRRVINCTKSRAAGVDPEKNPDLAVYEECNPIIVYGDTDSVMFNFGDITLAEAIRFGKEISALCNLDFPHPISLTFETIKLVALFLNRKRYAALQLERFIEGETMAEAIQRAQKTEANTAFKGLESKRRDNAPIGGGTQGRVLEILLWEQNVTKSEDYVKQTISDLLMGQVDMSQLVITKGLSKSEEQYARGGTKQQHVELRKRIQKRALETGEMVPETGDRVPYVMVSGTARKKGKNASKSSELSEDPLYAMRRGVPIDTDYYINKQIMPAVLRVFTGIYEPERCWEIESAMSDEKLHSFKAYQKLFARHLPHMQKRRTARVRNYGIAAFAQVLPACLGCGTRLAATAAPRPGQGGVCRRCVRIDVVRTKMVELAQKSKACKDAWATCRKCQGGAFGKVTCSNMSCGNFFHREKVITDLEDICNEIARF